MRFNHFLCVLLCTVTMHVFAVDMRGIIVSQDNDTMVITDPGVFKLNSNFTGKVSITANDVVLDLQGFGIASSGSPLILVAESVHNVTIKNGTVSGDDATALQKGIECGVGSSGVTISDMHIKDCMGFGVDVVGTSTSRVQNIVITHCQARNNSIGMQFTQVHNAAVQNCEMVSSTTGMQLNNCEKVCVQNSRASGNTTAGFSLINSSNNTFIECKAIDNGSDAYAFGFVSDSGMCNIFDACIAQSTATTGIDPFFAAGFLLTGTEAQSKIVHSQASNGSGYGIRLESFLISVTSIEPRLDLVASYFDHNASLQSVAWLNCGSLAFLAVCGSAGGDGAELRVLEFDCVDQTLQEVTNFATHNAVIHYVDWQICNNTPYLAIAGVEFDNAEVRIFRFNCVNPSLTEVATYTQNDAEEFCIRWQECNGTQFLAVGGTESSANGKQLRVLEFDCAAESLTERANFEHVERIIDLAWLVCDNRYFIAIGGEISAVPNDEVRVLEFDCSTYALTQVANFDGVDAVVFGLDWIVCNGEPYLAVGSGFGVGDSLRVLSFDCTASTLVSVDNNDDHAGEIFGVRWKECAGTPFLAIGGTQSFSSPGGAEARVFEFDCTTSTLTLLLSFTQHDADGQFFNTVAWGECGNMTYLAFAGAESTTDGAEVRVLEFASCFQSIGPVCNIVKKNHITNNAGVGLQDDAATVDLSTNEIYANFSCKNGTNFNIGTQFPITAADATGVGATENIDCSLAASEVDEVAELKFTIVDQAESLCSKIDLITDCGNIVITTPTTLVSDTSYCLANDVSGQITISNIANVTLDLNGYAVTNILVSTSNTIAIKNGIVNSGGTVTNGVNIVSSTDVVLDNLMIMEHAEGLRVQGSSADVLIKNCSCNNNINSGVFVSSGSNVFLISCEAHNNGAFEGFAFFGTGHRVLRCHAYNNGRHGFRVNSTGTLIQKCAAMNNGGFGFTSEGTPGNQTVATCFARGNVSGDYSASIEFGSIAASTASGTSAPNYWSNVST